MKTSSIPLIKAGTLFLSAGFFAFCQHPAFAEPSNTSSLLLETEAFEDLGGWTLDTQFTPLPNVGSPYLMAHGLGKPVKNAKTKTRIPSSGKWHIKVRTKDWVAPWKAEGTPGKFQVVVNGKPIETFFGTQGAEWHWQDGGSIDLPEGEVEVELKDMTGFNGRADAIYLTMDPKDNPPNADPELRAWRQARLGLPIPAPETEEYDLVVIGGGYAGTAAAISAARQGIKVALIQDRPVLGGNGSSEVGVWAQGGTMRGPYPHIGEIVEEFSDRAPDSPAAAEHFVDDKKLKLVLNEKNIDLFLYHHAYHVDKDPKTQKILSVTVLDCRGGGEKRFRGKLFVDATGHGHIGALAKASYQMTEEKHMGTSNMWYHQETEESQPWPETPWALPLTQADYPKTQKSKSLIDGKPFYKGEWFWESGFDQHPINDLEAIRDWNLRAVFGAFSDLKKQPEHAKTELKWVSPIGGTRESRRLEGDVILSDKDIISKKDFPDAFVPTTWDIDLHYPREQFAKKFPQNPFISRAEFGSGVDRAQGYPIPYRTFYSRTIPNLFMAGRNISVTHEALGTIRVMRTCGMMGEVVGKAAYVAIRNHTTPRGVYEQYLDQLIELVKQPGVMRRATLDSPLVEDTSLVRYTAPKGGPTTTNGISEYITPEKLEGLVVDDIQATLKGNWTRYEGLENYVGDCYLATAAGSNATATYEFKPNTGKYEIRVSWQAHENRATNTTLILKGTKGGDQTFTLNQRKQPDAPYGFHSLGVFQAQEGTPVHVIIQAKDTDGFAHADAVQLLPIP